MSRARIVEAARAELLERIASEALQWGDGPVITASTVYAFAQSPFAVWCDVFAPEDAKDPSDEFRKLLMEQGRSHEEKVSAARFPHAERMAYRTEEEGFRLALDAMADGAQAIRGAPVFHLPDGLKGRIDVLERRDDAPSRWGDHHYVVKEIKLAKNVRDHHRLQAAFYNHVLGKLQGYTPATFHVVNRDHEEVEFPYDEAEVLATLRAIRAIQQGLKPPAVHGAGLWPWESYTDRCAVEGRDVSLVGGVGPASREKLVGAGIGTVEELAAAEVSRLRAIKGIGEKTGPKLRTNAQAIVSGRHVRLGPVSLPDAPTEIFLDLEGTGAQPSAEGLVEVDYLIGALMRRGGREEYVPFVAHTPREEGKMLHAFVDWLAAQGECVLYHWHHYEATHLKKLAERHGLPEEKRALLAGSMRDLHKDATAAFAFPTYSTGLKSIAPYMGFQWRQTDVNAMESIALYFAYVEDPVGNADKLRKVLDYNQDDCVATRVVKDWLAQNG